MKSYKPHLLKKVMGDLRKVPLGSHESAPEHTPKHSGAHIEIVIGHAGKPGMDKPEMEDPAEEGMESPDLDETSDGMDINAPFGALKRPGHKFGK